MTSGNLPSKGVIGCEAFAFVVVDPDPRAPTLENDCNMTITSPATGEYRIAFVQPVNLLGCLPSVVVLNDDDDNSYFAQPNWVATGGTPDAATSVTLHFYDVVADAVADPSGGFWFGLLRMIP